MNTFTKEEEILPYVISLMTAENNDYKQVEGLVYYLQIAHENNWFLKQGIFNILTQKYHGFLQKQALLLFRYDPLIDKKPFQRKQMPEHYLVILGLFWEFIVKYDRNRGVYFTHYLEKRFEWHYKRLSRDRIRKKKYRDRPDDNYKLVSYEEALEKKDAVGNFSYGNIKIDEIRYDDNFDSITLEWSLRDPKEFVDDYTLFEATSNFTPKQMEVFTLELEGYKQEQIAEELRGMGTTITQQGVNERLLGVRKKIDKIQNKRGNHNESKSSNHPA